MGKWLDLGLPYEETIQRMIMTGIRRGLAETILDIELGKSTGDIEEKKRPARALYRLYDQRTPK